MTNSKDKSIRLYELFTKVVADNWSKAIIERDYSEVEVRALIAEYEKGMPNIKKWRERKNDRRS